MPGHNFPIVKRRRGNGEKTIMIKGLRPDDSVPFIRCFGGREKNSNYFGGIHWRLLNCNLYILRITLLLGKLGKNFQFALTRKNTLSEDFFFVLSKFVLAE